MPRPDTFRDDDRPVVVERRRTERGELVLRRAGPHFEVIANGTFLMDTRDGRSERALVREALPGGDGLRVLLGGLGVGFSLDEALRQPRVAEVVVCEVEAAVVEWARSHLRAVCEHGVDDPRVRVVVADLRDALTTIEGTFDAICLDIDNGPGWLVHAGNAAVYADAGLVRLGRLLAPGGRLAVWAAAADEAFAARLSTRFGAVRAVAIGVPRGPDDVVYVAERPAVSPATSP
jgi:spermidine synthase